mmetsp:Transcript_25334/g.40029  ORF Transcript_25334/g.40029 Transcript_25334/m.40029 type:complete len:243 (-) Transcript_25334:120-848(-)
MGVDPGAGTILCNPDGGGAVATDGFNIASSKSSTRPKISSGKLDDEAFDANSGELSRVLNAAVLQASLVLPGEHSRTSWLLALDALRSLAFSLSRKSRHRVSKLSTFMLDSCDLHVAFETEAAAEPHSAWMIGELGERRLSPMHAGSLHARNLKCTSVTGAPSATFSSRKDMLAIGSIIDTEAGSNACLLSRSLASNKHARTLHNSTGSAPQRIPAIAYVMPQASDANAEFGLSLMTLRLTS